MNTIKPMSTYRNNLEKNDRVYDTAAARQGKVCKQPRESSRMVAVIYDGTSTPKYIDILKLRLITNGKTPEDVPPCDGVPPEPRLELRQEAAPVGDAPDALAALKSEFQKNETEMVGMNARFKFLREKNERIERAVSALTQPV